MKRQTLARGLSAAVAALAFAACAASPDSASADPVASAVFAVVFDSRGGGDVPSQAVPDGERALRPDDLEKPFDFDVPGLFEATASRVLVGWYADGEPFDFDAPIAADVALEARWGLRGEVDLDGEPGATLLDRAVSRVNGSGGSFVLVLGGDEEAAGTFPPGRSLAGASLELRGVGGERRIRLSSNGILLLVDRGGSLSLGANATLEGRRIGGNGNAHNNGNLVRVNDGGVLVMNEGSRMIGNGNVSAAPLNLGAAVRVNGGGLFTMNGGEISGNLGVGLGSGGGVHVAGNGTFVMNGGLVTGNAAGSNGGGGVLTVGAGASFAMNGGEIYRNSAGRFSGGGALVVSNSSFVMRGGVIHGNSAGIGAGGVLVGEGATLSMVGSGEIRGNVAENGGGGVFVQAGGFFNLSGGAIYGNEAAAPADRRNRLSAASAGFAALSVNGVARRGAEGAWATPLQSSNATVRALGGEPR